MNTLTAEQLTQMLDEQFPQEDGNAIRGLFFGVLLSLPCWGAVVLVAVGINRLLAG